MCKPFPPPLVRGGVFLVGLETKYRDIADGNVHDNPFPFKVQTPVGNQVPRYSGWKLQVDYATEKIILVGNQVPRYSGWKRRVQHLCATLLCSGWKPSTAIQRMETLPLMLHLLRLANGWKPSTAIQRMETACDHKHVHAGPQVGNQVPGYSR